ncbi:MAG: RsiV family protein [Lachnospiraceae bacterium]|nr:RsiV family protein [Lachnospiraceae bacterium]
MNEFKHAKENYDNIPIPAELPERVQAGIRMGKVYYQNRRNRKLCCWIATAACFCAVLAGLNLSPTLASAAANVPLLGELFQVMTFVNYSKSEDGIHYNVSAPEVKAESALAEKVNTAIQEKIALHFAKAQQDWEDYREAFFTTGGTEEEWGDREMDVVIDYEIKSQTKEWVSFIVSFAEAWVSVYEECYYYNLDFTRDEELTLQDFLGENWVSICNNAIQKQIDKSVDANGFTYFFASDEEGFTTVDESTEFYIREDGMVVVCFPKYSIAAGAAGNLEFVVPIQEN